MPVAAYQIDTEIPQTLENMKMRLGEAECGLGEKFTKPTSLASTMGLDDKYEIDVSYLPGREKFHSWWLQTYNC